MQNDNINGQTTEVVIIAPDGTEIMEELTPVERCLLEKIDLTLRVNSDFDNTYLKAQLVRIDSNRGLNDRDEGRFYLRYKHIGGMAEFWGNVSDESQVDMERGIICVKG